METSDLTLQVLTEIRDEARKSNDRLERLEKGQTETNESLGRLERRQTDTEIRLATEIVAVVQADNSVKELIGERLDVRDKVADHERRILELERHTDV